MEGNTVTLVPAGLIWKAYSRRRLISTSSVRVECERRAVFLGWTIANPTYRGALQPVAPELWPAGIWE